MECVVSASLEEVVGEMGGCRLVAEIPLRLELRVGTLVASLGITLTTRQDDLSGNLFGLVSGEASLLPAWITVGILVGTPERLEAAI